MDSPIVNEISKNIDADWLKTKCPKNMHMISQSAEQVRDDGYVTFCCCCGARLVFQEKKDGTFEWVNLSF